MQQWKQRERIAWAIEERSLCTNQGGIMTRSRMIAALFIFSLLPLSLSAAPIVVTGCGDIAPRVSEFRTLLGGPVNGTAAGPQPAGRREINWDGVPAGVTNTNNFPGNFFNVTSTRGVLLSTAGSGLRVSDSNFNDVNAGYSDQLGFFSPSKTFAAVGSNIIDVNFRVSGSSVAAGVSGFGVVFSDVDTAGSTTLEFFDGNTSLGKFSAPVRCGGSSLSFLGVAFTDGTTATRVRITAGQGAPAAGVTDVSAGGTVDVVAMDDFIYSEPYADTNVLTAVLSGQNEVPRAATLSGVAVVTLDPATNTVMYAISVQPTTETPTAAHIHRGAPGVNGPIVIDFQPTFKDGIAFGSVTADSALIAEILANPSNFYVNVHTPAFPGGAARGQLSSTAVTTGERIVLPIAGRVAGANGTFYRTNVRIVNRSGVSVDAVAYYYASGSTTSAPTATANLTIAHGEQRALDDVLRSLFNIEGGTGAIVFVTPRPLIVVARVFNDQTVTQKGTFGQLVPGYKDDLLLTSGTLPFLQHQPNNTTGGSRTNVGWFNPNGAPVSVTFRAFNPGGGSIGSVTRTVAPNEQQQFSLGALFPAIEVPSDLYLTFETTGGGLDVYASVVDNVSGDGTFITPQL
jgi:hypothetical protein